MRRDTVTVGPRPPFVGRPVAKLTLSGQDTTVFAIVRGQTSDLVEDEDQPIQPGDRSVIATRAGALAELRRMVSG